MHTTLEKVDAANTLMRAIENDDYELLFALAKKTEQFDYAHAKYIRRLAFTARQNVWGHDEERDNSL